MKIVKMHEGSREAFDDFLEQRLNEVEIDNDMADKYFANMNLPVPVIPAPATSFFSTHKNKLWSLVLLLSIGFISILVVKNNENKKGIVKDEAAISEKKASVPLINEDKNKNVLSNEEIRKPQEMLENEKVINKNNNTTSSSLNNNTVSEKNKTGKEIVNKKSDNDFAFKKQKLLESNTVILVKGIKTFETNNLGEKKTNVFANERNDFKNEIIDLNKSTLNKKVQNIETSKLQNTNPSKTLKVEPKVETKKVDSLYIVW
jgi:hypothetical protein